MPKRIKRTRIPKRENSRINPSQLNEERGISFSFRYYQDGSDKFNCRGAQASYWTSLLERLKAVSSLSVKELLTNRSSALRCHPIVWEQTSEKEFGLPNEAQLVDTPYQFSISSNKYGRVHGFFIARTFYIVWLDPEHRLYAAKR